MERNMKKLCLAGIAAIAVFGAQAANLPPLKWEQEVGIRKLAGVDNLNKLTPVQEQLARELFYTVDEKKVLKLAGVTSVQQLSKEQAEGYKKLLEYTGLPELKPEWTAKLKELIGTSLPEKPRDPRNPKKILVFYRTDGYCHGSSIVAGNEAIRIAADDAGAWKVDFSDDYMSLQPYNLEKYDALVLNNTTNLKTDRYRFVAAAIVDFVKYGKGLAVIHSGDDGFNEAPDILYMIGGRFCGHPWGAGGTWKFKVEDPASALVKSLDPKGFKFSDEIYMQSAPYFSREALHVLLSLDMSDPDTAKALARSDVRKRKDGDYAVSWVRKFGRGRVFYSSFGHDHRAWLNGPTLKHLLTGIQYACRDVNTDDEPSSPQMIDPAKK